MSPNDTVESAQTAASPDYQRGQKSWVRVVSTILVMVALQLPFGDLVRGNGLFDQVLREGLFWIMTLLLLSHIWFVEKRPLCSIGLRRPNWKSLLFGLLAALVMLGGSILIYLVVFPALGLAANAAGLKTVQSTPIWFQALVVLRAPVFEEIFYRGFMIERLTEITGVRWLAALISLIAFTSAHLSYWGWATLVVVAFEGAILTLLYLYRRDLAANMIAHFALDAASFLLL